MALSPLPSAALLAVTLLAPQHTAAARFSVDSVFDAVDAAPGDGACADAGGQCTLRAAVIETNALAGLDTILVPAGTYTLALAGVDEDASATGDLDVLDDLVIRGAGAGVTIIDAAGLDRVLDRPPPGPNVSLTLAAITITGGSTASRGGGVRALESGELLVVAAAVESNTGGGIVVEDSSSLDLLDSIVRNNTGTGVVALFADRVRIRSSQITMNDSVGQGGGIEAFWSGPIEIEDSEISHNTFRAGIFAQLTNGFVRISGSTIASNVGEGIQLGDGGTFTIEDSLVEGNTRAGIHLFQLFQGRIDRTTVTGNMGGGIEVTDFTRAQISNSTIVGNTGNVGGGVLLGFALGSASQINGSTISGNSAALGGGVAVDMLDDGGFVHLQVANSVIAGNSATGSNPDCFTRNQELATDPPLVESLGHNVIGDVADCAFLAGPGDQLGSAGSPIDPQLAPLADNGGPTQTRALLASSPALDSASPATPGSGGGACEPFDQRGVARPQPGVGGGGSVCDVGAYEHFASCGDGQVEHVEACDDGNAAAGDGCDAICRVEPGFACSGNPSSCAPPMQPGFALSQQKVGSTQGGFTGPLDNNARFGASLAALDDLDGNGETDLAVGAPFTPAGGRERGRLWLLFLSPDGTVGAEHAIDGASSALAGLIDDGDRFGHGVAAVGDLDDDGVVDLAVGAPGTDRHRGAVWVLLLNSDGTVKAAQPIGMGRGGFGGSLDPGDQLGSAVAALGDLDGDGVEDLAAGAPRDDAGGKDRGAVWILFLSSDGTVKTEQKISFHDGGFAGELDNRDLFGASVAAIEDLDGNGTPELGVGATRDRDGGPSRGAVWILFLTRAGVVWDHAKISSTEGGFTGALDHRDSFGSSLTSLGDLNGDLVPDLAAGAISDDDGGPQQGALWLLFLQPDGSVKAHQKVSATQGGFGGALDPVDLFGASAALRRGADDGEPDLAVGAILDDDGGPGRGAVWLLDLEGLGCGDALVGVNEQCDDGNRQSGDGCSASCEREEH